MGMWVEKLAAFSTLSSLLTFSGFHEAGMWLLIKAWSMCVACPILWLM